MKQNLLTFSEQIDNAIWSKSLCSISANAIAAPDGNLTADGILATSTAASTHRSLQNFPAAITYTFSIYLKAGVVSWAQFVFNSSGTSTYFNLSGAGSIGGTNAPSNSIVSVGNGWYRCSSTVAANAGGNYGFQPASADGGGSYAAADTTTPQIYAWGAQLVQANWPGEYTPTTTIGVGIGQAPRNLVVPALQNFYLFSEQFDNAAWNKTNSTVSANAIIAPDGNLTADGMISNTLSNTTHRFGIVETNGAILGGPATNSFYVKAGAVSWCQLYINNTNNTAYFNLTGAGSTGATTNLVGTTTSTITNVGNGWYRCSITCSVRVSSSSQAYIMSANADATGNTYAASDTSTPQIYVWGAQYVGANWAGDYQSTTATAIGSTTPPRNLVVPQLQNVVWPSEDFTAVQWTKRGTVSLTTGQTDPLGGTSAILVSGIGASGANDMFNFTTPGIGLVGGQIHTPSVYIKRVSTTGTFAIQSPFGSPFGLWLVDLSLLSNNWERITPRHPALTISIPFTVKAQTGGVQIGLQLFCSAGAPISVNLFGAQIVMANYEGDYQKTTTGVIGSTTPPRNLVVPQLQNLLLQSQTFDNGALSKSNVTVTPDLITAPDATLTADGIISSTTSSILHRLLFPVSANQIVGSTLTLSCYAKTGVQSWALLNFNSLNKLAYFNLSGVGSVGTTLNVLGSSITNVGNGWYRCSITFIYDVLGGNMAVSPSAGDGGNTYAAADTTSVQIYAWGAQLVQTNQPGDYIATTSAAIGATTPPRNINIASQNLFTFPEAFDNGAWSPFHSTVTPDQVANPITGAINADLLTDDSSLQVHFITETTTQVLGAIYTQSIYVKKNTGQWFIIATDSASNFASFDLTNGITGTMTGPGAISSIIEPVANQAGWYRLSFTYKATFSTSGLQRFYTANGNNVSSYQGASALSYYLYGAMLNQGYTASQYQPGNTAAINNGAPRQNVIASQNLFTFPEAFDNAAWTKANSSALADQIANPISGAVNADLFSDTVDGGSASHSIGQAVTQTAKLPYTISVYAKANGGQWLSILAESGVSIAYFDVLNGLPGGFISNGVNGVTYVSSSMDPYGNGWYRCSFTFTTTSTGAVTHQLRHANSNSSSNYQGTGASKFYIYGAMINQGYSAAPYLVGNTAANNNGAPRRAA